MSRKSVLYDQQQINGICGPCNRLSLLVIMTKINILLQHFKGSPSPYVGMLMIGEWTSVHEQGTVNSGPMKACVAEQNWLAKGFHQFDIQLFLLVLLSRFHSYIYIVILMAVASSLLDRSRFPLPHLVHRGFAHLVQAPNRGLSSV